jgi:SAM-dependent methyltransferase
MASAAIHDRSQRELGMDKQTSEFYDTQGSNYAKMTFTTDMVLLQNQFLELLPSKATQILDAGCGSGRDTLAFHKAGFQVTAFDASATLVRAANELTGLKIQQLLFDEIQWLGYFHGIWACASLVHLTPDKLALTLHKFSDALLHGGILYFSVKQGSGEARDAQQRYFYYYKEVELQALLLKDFPSLHVLKCFSSTSKINKDSEVFLNYFLAKK